MLDFTDNLSSCCIFSKIDLRKGYFQILMSEDDIAKTAVVTQFGRQWSGQQRCHMFPGGKTCSGWCHLVTTSWHISTPGSPSRCFSFPLRSSPAAAARWDKYMETTQIFLQEAVSSTDQVECLGQIVMCLLFRHKALQIHPRRTCFHHLHRPQATHFRPLQVNWCLDFQAVQTPVLGGWVYLRYSARGRFRECGGRCTLQASFFFIQ